MNLHLRLARLERSRPPATSSVPCEVCGGPPARDKIKWIVEFEEPGRSREHDFCRACGRRLVYHIEFDQGG